MDISIFMEKKNLGQNLKAANSSWTFDKNVWKNFDDHINKSIFHIKYYQNIYQN